MIIAFVSESQYCLYATIGVVVFVIFYTLPELASHFSRPLVRPS